MVRGRYRLCIYFLCNLYATTLLLFKQVWSNMESQSGTLLLTPRKRAKKRAKAETRKTYTGKSISDCVIILLFHTQI